MARVPACLGSRLLFCVCMQERLEQPGEDNCAAVDYLGWMARVPADAGDGVSPLAHFCSCHCGTS